MLATPEAWSRRGSVRTGSPALSSAPKVRPKGDKCYAFVVHFEDGTKDELTIRQGVHVNDWSYPDDTLPGSRLAWTGMAAGDRMMAGVFFTEWKNPKSQVKIASVDFVGTGKSVAVLMAITGYKGSLERGWLAPEHTHSR